MGQSYYRRLSFCTVLTREVTGYRHLGLIERLQQLADCGDIPHSWMKPQIVFIFVEYDWHAIQVSIVPRGCAHCGDPHHQVQRIPLN
jgi:hypothetical protein